MLILTQVIVYGDDRAEKETELKALVKQTPGCHIVREFNYEGNGFMSVKDNSRTAVCLSQHRYIMTSAVARDPLEEYIDNGRDALVPIKKQEKHPWATAEYFANFKEGAAYPFKPEDEIVDVPEAV